MKKLLVIALILVALETSVYAGDRCGLFGLFRQRHDCRVQFNNRRNCSRFVRTICVPVQESVPIPAPAPAPESVPIPAPVPESVPIPPEKTPAPQSSTTVAPKNTVAEQFLPERSSKASFQFNGTVGFTIVPE